MRSSDQAATAASEPPAAARTDSDGEAEAAVTGAAAAGGAPGVDCLTDDNGREAAAAAAAGGAAADAKALNLMESESESEDEKTRRRSLRRQRRPRLVKRRRTVADQGDCLRVELVTIATKMMISGNLVLCRAFVDPGNKPRFWFHNGATWTPPFGANGSGALKHTLRLALGDAADKGHLSIERTEVKDKHVDQLLDIALMVNGGAGIKDGTFITNMRTKARTLLPMRGGCLDVSGSTPRVVPMPREALVFSDEVRVHLNGHARAQGGAPRGGWAVDRVGAVVACVALTSVFDAKRGVPTRHGQALAGAHRGNRRAQKRGDGTRRTILVASRVVPRRVRQRRRRRRARRAAVQCSDFRLRQRARKNAEIVNEAV